MEAARKEFATLWKEGGWTDGFAKCQLVRVEQLCWHFFLHAKGLKK